MKIYADIQSGNCDKIKLLTSLLDIEHDWIKVDIMADETLSEAFLHKNPNGKIPLLELDDGRLLSESNAILNYLASGATLVWDKNFVFAKIQQW